MTEFNGASRRWRRPAWKLKGASIALLPFLVALVLARTFLVFASFMMLISGMILAAALIAIVFFRKGFFIALASLVSLLVFHHLATAISPPDRARIP